jgi:hypothetical protein
MVDALPSAPFRAEESLIFELLEVGVNRPALARYMPPERVSISFMSDSRASASPPGTGAPARLALLSENGGASRPTVMLAPAETKNHPTRARRPSSLCILVILFQPPQLLPSPVHPREAKPAANSQQQNQRMIEPPCSLFLVPCSLFLVPCSLFLVP